MLTHIFNLFVSSIPIESDTFSYETQSILGEGFFGIVDQAKAIRKSGELRLRKSTAVDMPPIVFALKCIKERGLPDPVDLFSLFASPHCHYRSYTFYSICKSIPTTYVAKQHLPLKENFCLRSQLIFLGTS